jgi:hypothetical protein
MGESSMQRSNLHTSVFKPDTSWCLLIGYNSES